MALPCSKCLFSYQLLTLRTGNVPARCKRHCRQRAMRFADKERLCRLKVRLYIVDRLLNVVASVVSGNPLEISKYCLNLLEVPKVGIRSSNPCTVSTNNPPIDSYCSRKASRSGFF